jgi:uncharacterized protein YyaL (SSP411 family)
MNDRSSLRRSASLRTAGVVAGLLTASCHDATSRPDLAPSNAPAAIAWQSFTDDVFATAKREKRLVLLDVGTGWCHWCHVMDETTYRDKDVVKLVGERFVAARADADERLDLANRYEQYGWPATIVFDASGVELVKMRGFMEAPRLASLLQACVDDPTPGPSARRDPTTNVEFATSAALDAGLRDALAKQHSESYDATHAGFGDVLKYLPEWSVEYDLELARRGDTATQGESSAAAKRATATLDANLALIDPAWGGVYQYSHGGDWSHPHFEKIMSFQSLDLRLYAEAAELLGGERHDETARARYTKAAQAIHSYLVNFLRSGSGAFYTSQDADLVDGEHGGEYFALDDAHRRALGMPRIDTNVYARENGWAIEGLALLYEATGDESALADALAAAKAMLVSRRVDAGGFRHGEHDSQPLYLGDTLAMGVALYELHLATGERAWLDSAIACADFVEKNFRNGIGGATNQGASYTTALARPDASGATPQPQRDENATIARFANRLFRETNDARFKAMVDRALRYLVTPAIARQMPAATALLVADETSHEPIHVTIVGARDDDGAKAMFARALRIATRNKLVQWYDPALDPPLPDGNTYPASDRAAAYFCANGGCAPPVYDVAALERLIVKNATR